MKRAWILLVPILACGCAELSTPTAVPTLVPSPALMPGGTLFILNAPGNQNSGQLFLNSDSDTVNRLFHPDNATFSRDVPPGFSQNYIAETYSSGNTGFGALYAKDSNGEEKLALAMQQEQIPLSEVQSTVQDYQTALNSSPTVVSAPDVDYWFWEDASHHERLMLCAVRSKADDQTYSFTTALGDDQAMDALRMNEADARFDSRAFEGGPSSTGSLAPQSQAG